MRILLAAAAAVVAALLVTGGDAGEPSLEHPGKICPDNYAINDHNLCADETGKNFKYPKCDCRPQYLCNYEHGQSPLISEQLCGRRRNSSEARVCCYSSAADVSAVYASNTISKCGAGKPEGSVVEYEARRGEFPWIAAILKVSSDAVWSSESDLVAPGVLIHRRVVLTTAHKFDGVKHDEVKVRMGVWDSQDPSEYNPSMQSAVKTIFKHPEYYRSILSYDIALLIVEFPHGIPTVCLSSITPNEETKCVGTGWGRRGMGLPYSTKLKKMRLPLVHRLMCQRKLQIWRRKSDLQLHESVVCAGGREGEDTCTGDGGAPLLCPVEGSDGGELRYSVVGVTSWGAGCGAESVPGVYADITLIYNWLTGVLNNNFGIDPAEI